jgi:hypothetical protein
VHVLVCQYTCYCYHYHAVVCKRVPLHFCMLPLTLLASSSSSGSPALVLLPLQVLQHTWRTHEHSRKCSAVFASVCSATAVMCSCKQSMLVYTMQAVRKLLTYIQHCSIDCSRATLTAIERCKCSSSSLKLVVCIAYLSLRSASNSASSPLSMRSSC